MKTLTCSIRTLLIIIATIGNVHLTSAAPAADTWTGNTDTNWSSAGNWTGGNAPPQPGDSLIFGSSSITTLNNDLAALTAINGIAFTGSDAFTLNGNSVLISGNANGNVGAVGNASGLTQTLGTMQLTLDAGPYIFVSSAGGSIALNGGLMLNPGGLAYFDPNVTSTALTLDGTTGLINGLEGSGLMFSGNAPTSLATISGGAIVPYTAYTPIASGAIGDGNNIELTASGSATAYSANNSTVNSITVDQTGNSTGTSASTLAVTGVLTLGAQGGVYVLNSGNLGNKGIFIITNGIITAGTSGPAAIVFAVNGNNANNQVSVASTISNNIGGGPVTVVMAGPGSMNFSTTTTSSYSGGVYVDQGQLQFGQLTQIGTGPVHIAAGASLYYTGTGVISNNLFLSPGNGAGSSAAVAGGAGLITVGASGGFSGTLTLNGAAVPPPSANAIGTPTGDTFSGNATGGNYTNTGKITGTGTLQFTAAHSYTFVMKNTNQNNPNDFQGGMIIGGHAGVAANVLIQMGSSNQIPHGPNTGDINFYPTQNSGNSFARFDLNGFNQTVNGLNASTPFATTEAQILNQAATPCTLTFGANNSSVTYSGSVIDGSTAKALSLNKIGTGTQTFSGNTNTYFGNTTVSAGTLAYTATAFPPNSPLFAVASGATLDGSFLSTGGVPISSSQSLVGLGTVVGSTAINGKISPFLNTIGTLTNNGQLQFNGGGTYVWDINNATGTAGADPGWGLLNVTNAGITVNANAATPFIIKITSLTPGDVPGNAVNFNENGTTSWTIAQTTAGISGFSPSAFVLDTTGFSNPKGSGGFSLGLSPDQTALVLTFTGTQVITTPLVNQTNNAGTTATFTATANGATPPITFQWLDNNNSELISGNTTASGASIMISTNGHTSTLTLGGTGVQDSDAGGYTVNVSDNSSDTGTSSASLTVIDAPTNSSIAKTVGEGIAAGGAVTLTATSGGTGPFTYVWRHNGIVLTNGGHISGANSSNLVVDLGPGDTGNYTVVISNGAGGVTNDPFVLGPVTSVPNQIIYEPFTSYTAQTFPPGGPDTWENVTNLYNQLDGDPAFWFHSSGSGVQMIVQANDLANGQNNQNGGTYPWPGLAGNSSNCLYWSTSVNNHLEFAQHESFAPGTSVYFSFIMSCSSLGSTDGTQDMLAGFVTSADGTAFNLKLSSQIVDHAAGQYQLGVSKGSGKTGTQGVDANTAWASTPILAQQDIFVVCAYNVVSGGTTATDDTVSLWINPDPSTFYATNPPTPTVGPVTFAVANSIIRDFGIHAVAAPASHRMADLRIGTTWASVTPPAAPALLLANISTTAGSTAVFASQNAGNPVAAYSWRFNGGAPLTDNAHYSGTSTGALTINNVQPSDIGTYTVTGINNDPLTNSIAYTNSASATLTIASIGAPTLQVAYSAPNVIISWPAGFAGYTLQGSPTLSPAIWSTFGPQVSSGSNITVTVNAATGNQYFRLIK